uniref:Putative secreted protein n=1 Tax=Amblyomma triste TaxID=251400 RepID=A0A023G386_AMBTT
MSAMKLAAFALILLAPLSKGNPDIPVVDDSDKLDIQKAFHAGIKYAVDFQGVYVNQTELGDKCLVAQRQRPVKKNEIRFSFWNGNEKITALAKVAFSSTTASEINDRMHIQSMDDRRLSWLETTDGPYRLLFAEGKACMVMQVPRSHVPEETRNTKEREGEPAVKYCVVLVASDSLQEGINSENCATYFKANCGIRGQSPRIKNEQCFKAFLPTEAST